MMAFINYLLQFDIIEVLRFILMCMLFTFIITINNKEL